jgi:hypothetical protein
MKNLYFVHLLLLSSSSSYSLHFPKKNCHRTEYGDTNFLSRPIIIVNFTFCCIFALFLLTQYTFLSVFTVYLPCIKITEYQPPKSLFHCTTDFLHNPVLLFKMHLVSVSPPKKTLVGMKSLKYLLGNFYQIFKTAFILPCHFNYHVMFSIYKFYIFSATHIVMYSPGLLCDFSLMECI